MTIKNKKIQDDQNSSSSAPVNVKVSRSSTSRVSEPKPRSKKLDIGAMANHAEVSEESEQAGEEKAQWYAIHTYSGYEENVLQNLKQRIASMNVQNKVFDVIVPKEKKIKIRNGRRKIVTEKIFPGYVLVKMIVDDESWYVVRNTVNVTGFIGQGTIPVPISQQEIKTLQKRMGIEEPKFKIDFVIDDLVKITDGPFKNLEGKIFEIDEMRGKIKILVNIFKRETPVELDCLQVKKV